MVAAGGALAAEVEAQPQLGSHRHFPRKKFGTRVGSPRAARGRVGLFAQGGEVGAGTSGGCWDPSPPWLLHGTECVCAKPSASARRWQCGECGVTEDDPDLAPQPHACHLSSSSCTHVSVVQPHSRVPVPFPATALKEEASPPTSPHHDPGDILGLEKSGRQHQAGDALQHAGDGGGQGKRNTNLPGGQGKRICLT